VHQPQPQQQQQQQQQVTQQDIAANPQLTLADASSAQQLQEQQQQQLLSRQLLWDTAAQLGLKRGSEIAPPDITDSAGSHLPRDSSTSSGSRAAASSRRRRSRASSSSSSSSGSSSSSRPDVGTAVDGTTSSSIDAAGSHSIDQDDDHVSDSISFSSRDDAVVAAIARLGRFLDFRERCASEVLAKLAALGYDKQLAQRALQELQDAVSTACTVHPGISDLCVAPGSGCYIRDHGALAGRSGMQHMLLCCL
jgi:hypothetical protein